MFNVDALRLQIEALIRDYPELAEDDVLRADMLDGATDIKEALTALVRKCGDDAAMIAALDERIEELSVRQVRFKRRIDARRSLMLSVLQAADLKNYELAEATLSQRRGAAQLAGEPDMDALPDDLVKVTRSPNRAAIKQALEQGRNVPGCYLSEPQLSLSIRTK